MRLAATMLTLGLTLATASMLWAGEKGKAKPRGEREMPAIERVERLLKCLDLTEEQTAKFQELKKAYGPKFKENVAKMAAVPTAEQKQARDKAVKEAKKAGKSHQEASKAGREAMNLSDEQKAALAKLQKQQGALRKEFIGKVKEILTPEQREQLKREMSQRRERRK